MCWSSYFLGSSANSAGRKTSSDLSVILRDDTMMCYLFDGNSIMHRHRPSRRTDLQFQPGSDATSLAAATGEIIDEGP